MFAKRFLTSYKKLQEKHPDRVILMRVSDFYFAFYESANKVSDTIKQVFLFNGVDEEGKTVTATSFPHCMLDTYLHMLIRQKLSVAVSSID